MTTLQHPKLTEKWQVEELEKLIIKADLHGFGKAFINITSLLAVAAEPLNPNFLKFLIGEPAGLMQQALRHISPVVSGTLKIGFFHHSMQEAAYELLTPEAIKKAHINLSDWCNKMPADSYAAYHIRHLIGAEKFDAAAEKITLKNLNARINSGATLEELFADIRRFISATKGENKFLPIVCRVLNDVSLFNAGYHNNQNIEDLVMNQDIAGVIEFAELLDVRGRRGVLLAALLICDSKHNDFDILVSEIESDLDGIRSQKEREAISSILLYMADKPSISQLSKCDVNRLPTIAFTAAVSGNVKLAVSALRSYIKRKFSDDFSQNFRCLSALAYIQSVPVDLMEHFCSTVSSQAEIEILQLIVKKDVQKARQLLQKLPCNYGKTKTGVIRNHIILWHLAGVEEKVGSLLSTLMDINLEVFLQAISFVVDREEPSDRHIDMMEKALEKHKGSRANYASVCRILVKVGKMVAGALFLLRGIELQKKEIEPPANSWTEEVVDILTYSNYQESLEIAGSIKTPARQAMAYATIAANLSEKENSRRQECLRTARNICESFQEYNRSWFRVWETIAFASNNDERDFYSFRDYCHNIKDLNLANTFCELLCLRFAGDNKFESAENTAKFLIGLIKGRKGEGRSLNYRIRMMYFWIGYYAARYRNNEVCQRAIDRVKGLDTGGETLARLFGKIAFAEFENGENEKAAIGFARAIHLARQIKLKTGQENLHGIASALDKISFNEFKADHKIEARAHIFEAAGVIRDSDHTFVLTEIAGTMVELDMLDEAIKLIEFMPTRKRQDQTRGYIAYALISKAFYEKQISQSQRMQNVVLAKKMLNQIESRTGRVIKSIEILEKLIPRRANYKVDDPLPDAYPAVIDFILGASGDESSQRGGGILTDNLNCQEIIGYSIRILIRMHKKSEHVPMLKKIYYKICANVTGGICSTRKLI